MHPERGSKTRIKAWFPAHSQICMDALPIFHANFLAWRKRAILFRAKITLKFYCAHNAFKKSRIPATAGMTMKRNFLFHNRAEDAAHDLVAHLPPDR